jgi:hypothetical protein
MRSHVGLVSEAAAQFYFGLQPDKTSTRPLRQRTIRIQHEDSSCSAKGSSHEEDEPFLRKDKHSEVAQSMRPLLPYVDKKGLLR